MPEAHRSISHFMSIRLRTRQFVPLSLGIVMLAVVLAAGLAPNTGAVPAQTNCTYGQCPAATTPFPWYLVAIAVLVVIVALLSVLFLMQRRRRPPAPSAAQPWQGGPPTNTSISPFLTLSFFRISAGFTVSILRQSPQASG